MPRFQAFRYIASRLLFWFVLGYALVECGKANCAKADDVHVAHYGDRAWIADELKDDYQVKAKAAGRNYEHVPLAYREYEIRTELARTGCYLTRHMASAERGPLRRREIIRNCEAQIREWRVQLHGAMDASGDFPFVYGGQTILATMPVKTVHKVIRSSIKHANDTNARAIFDKLIVPLLSQACKIGLCKDGG